MEATGVSSAFESRWRGDGTTYSVNSSRVDPTPPVSAPVTSEAEMHQPRRGQCTRSFDCRLRRHFRHGHRVPCPCPRLLVPSLPVLHLCLCSVSPVSLLHRLVTFCYPLGVAHDLFMPQELSLPPASYTPSHNLHRPRFIPNHGLHHTPCTRNVGLHQPAFTPSQGFDHTPRGSTSLALTLAFVYTRICLPHRH